MPGSKRFADDDRPSAPYIGRFAPSPTGQLHFGTLTTAVASFLHARQAGGDWVVRIEDIDPPREVPGSADGILRTLEALALEWDGPVLFQSQRLAAHLEAAERLIRAGETYRCSCSRRQIRTASSGGTRYPGTCRRRTEQAEATSVRIKVDPGPIRFTDRLRGPIAYDIDAATGDFIIVRRDGLPAYHLAVVVDDAFQRVTDIVRGGDLLESTASHRYLQERLGLPRPAYWHIPLVTNAAGDKLSKSEGAAAVDRHPPSEAAARSLALLGLKLPAELRGAPPAELWSWAGRHWRIETLAARTGSTATADSGAVIADDGATAGTGATAGSSVTAGGRGIADDGG